MSLRPSVSYWNAGRKKAAGRDRGMPDFAQFAALLEGYRQDGEWEDYFPLAGAQKFQAALAAEAARTGEIDALGPLRVLDEALGHAVELGRVTDAAGLALAVARWTRRLELRTALGALRPGGLATAPIRVGDSGQPPVKDPVDVLRALQVRAGLLPAADRTIADLTGHDLLSADHGWEAAATLVTALAARGDLAAAVSALSRIPDFALCYSRAVRALAQAVARTDPAGAEELAARLPEQSGGRALNAVATAALAAGHRQDAERIANAIEVPGWRAQALIGLVGALPSADALPPGLVEDALAAVTDPATHARLLAEYAVTRDGKDRTRLLNQAKRRARKADGEDRWSVLAEIAVTEAEAGLPSVAETFAFARDLLLADFDESERDLLELCRLQLLAGDSAGARQTIAAALPLLARSPVAGRAGPALVSRITAALGRLSPARNGGADAADEDLAGTAPEGDRLLAPAALASIATCLADSGATGQARGTVATAARMAAGLRGEQRAIAADALAHAYVAVGDFDAGESLALSLLPEENWDEEDDHDWAETRRSPPLPLQPAAEAQLRATKPPPDLVGARTSPTTGSRSP